MPAGTSGPFGAAVGSIVFGSENSNGEPPITVVPARPDLDVLIGEADDDVTLVTRADLAAAVAAVVEERRRSQADAQAAIVERHVEAQRRRDAAVAAVEQAVADRDALLEKAAWAESQPRESRAAAAQIQELAATVAQIATRGREARRALDAVLEQQRSAEATLAEAREELRRGSQARGAGDATRRDALEALDGQAKILEARLAEAVSQARARVDAVGAELDEAEHQLELLHEQDRRRRPALLAALETLPRDRRPQPGHDPLLDAAQVADGLRHVAASREAVLVATRLDAEAAERALATVAAELTAAQDALEQRPDDVAAALGARLGTVGALVVLDDPVDAADWPAVLATVESWAASGSGTVIVATDDAQVLEWAIDLPPQLGRVLGPAALDRLLARPNPLYSPAPSRVDEPARPDEAEVPAVPVVGRFGLGLEDLVPKRTEPQPRVPEPEPVAADGPIVTLERLREFAFTSPLDEEPTE